jgi:endonuclease/exonuclease/phosphatase family metal-dependent hydrolase
MDRRPAWQRAPAVFVGTVTPMIRSRVALLIAATVALLAPLPAAALASPGVVSAPAAAPMAEGDGTITVMGRNLYLGADVGVALDLLPDMPAAAQFMWDQVAANDFSERVSLLAAEAAAARPDVIGLQEATVWACKPNPWSGAVTVFDFTEDFLQATAEAGTAYAIAERDGVTAYNPGYEIPPIPFLSTVEDPQTFQPLFGKDSADCGFTIADALLVRADLADQVVAVGTGEYDERYAVVPVVFTIDRGYAWADLAVGGTTVRAVTTHLESLWSPDSVPPSAAQAQQLVADLAETTIPLVVMGDFNSDPRDPRTDADPNPGGQPEAGTTCAAQPAAPTAATADPTCSAYWTMVDAGYADAGPDSLAPANRTWGSEGDLAGPNPERLEVALAEGNEYGFTDRLDYVFTRNGANATRAAIIGNRWPEGNTWQCDDPEQIETTTQSSTILAEKGLISAPITDRGVCLPTDHAGIVAVVDVSGGPAGEQAAAAPPDHSPLFRIGLLGWILIILGGLLLLVLLVVWGIYRLATRGRRRRRREAAAAAQH